MGGKWECTQKECPPTCQVIGEDHYITFDGRSYQVTDQKIILDLTKPRKYFLLLNEKTAALTDIF